MRRINNHYYIDASHLINKSQHEHACVKSYGN